MKWINLPARIIVGALFIFSGLIKLNDPVGTAIKLEEYFEVFSSDISPFFHVFVPYALILAVLLSVLEVVLGVAVLLKYKMKVTTWILLLLIVFFTFLTFYSAYFNKVTDCGCFGDAIKLTPWESFIKDIILLVLIGVLFINRHRFEPSLKRRTSDIIVGSSLLASLAIAVYAIAYLPFIDFRAYKVGANIAEQMMPSAELEYKYIMEKNGETFELEKYPTDPAYTYKEMVLLNPEVQPKITDYNIWNDKGDYTEESLTGNKLFIIMYDVEKADTEHLSEIKALSKELGESVQTIVLTSSGGPIYDRFRHEHQLAIPYYFGDATVLKTIVRSNPGLVLLQDGTVKGKWHNNAVPEAWEVMTLLHD